jgi:hypothetical protein
VRNLDWLRSVLDPDPDENRVSRYLSWRRNSPATLAVIPGVNINVGANCAVFDSRGYSRIHAIQVTVCRDDRRSALIVPIIDDLEEFLRCPRGRVLGAEVIENEQARVADVIEAAIVAQSLVRSKRRAQIIEKVGHDGEEWKQHLTLRDIIRNRSGKVRLAASKRAGQQQPTVRILGIFQADLKCLLHSRDVRIEGLKRPVFENTETADVAVVLAAARVNGALPALTDDRLAK